MKTFRRSALLLT